MSDYTYLDVWNAVEAAVYDLGLEIAWLKDKDDGWQIKLIKVLADEPQDAPPPLGVKVSDAIATKEKLS